MREHLYYRCANNDPDADHPRVRWRAEDLDEAVRADLTTLVLPSREIADWFRAALRATFEDNAAVRDRERQTLLGRQRELTTMKDRLLAAYLAGAVDAGTFQTKSTDFAGQLVDVERRLERCGDIDVRRGDNGRSRGDIAIAVFDWSQEAPAAWERSKMAQKRAILESLSLNRTLSATSLCLTKRKPFSFLAERPLVQLDRGDRI